METTATLRHIVETIGGAHVSRAGALRGMTSLRDHLIAEHGGTANFSTLCSEGEELLDLLGVFGAGPARTLGGLGNLGRGLLLWLKPVWIKRKTVVLAILP
jgi:hypothetical protein